MFFFGIRSMFHFPFRADSLVGCVVYPDDVVAAVDVVAGYTAVFRAVL